MSARSQPPSPRRLREARREGNVPRSKLAGAAGVTAGASIGGTWFLGGRSQSFAAWATHVWGAPDTLTPTAALLQAQHLFLSLTVPVCLGALAGATAMGLVSTGFLFEPNLPLPRSSRLDVSGVGKRLFSSRSLEEWGRGLVAGVFVLVVAATALPRSLSALLQERDGLERAAQVLRLLREAWIRAVVALFAVGIVDVVFTRWRHRRSLRMTREEVKREWKDNEGDPLQRGHRRAAHRQLAMGGPARGVQTATAIVVNPTHLAVALRYVEQEADAPYVVAKGRDRRAAELRAEAQTMGIPVIQNVGLARGLIHLALGELIPEELYVAAAAVLQVANGAASGVG